jgi:WD40 repeat protein
MSTSPSLSVSQTPLVLIGHSMGGLVIKKAYLLARQDTAYEVLARRIHTMYFLATPHRGSSSAKLLSNVLRAAFSSRAYVADLKRSSSVIQSINEEFEKYSGGIVLWSFYETQKLKLGVLSVLIVDPESAVLGYPDEKQMPMNADHRSICKFETISDPNYLIIRNALASTVASISKSGMTQISLPLGLTNFITVANAKGNIWRSQVKDLQKYLGVPENPENDLATVEAARLSGTCEWFSHKNSFLNWEQYDPESPSILWVMGKPGTGKSVLAGHVIDHIQKAGASCSFFFFKHGSRLDSCLRSLAFQMAFSNAQIRKALLEIQQDEIHLDMENERMIWQKLFLNGIFRAELSRHYWVIDALDQCVNSSCFFALMLAKLDGTVPLRILITSRETSELEKNFMTLGSRRFRSERISTADTLPDIKLLIEAKSQSFVVIDDKDRASLLEKILEKSQGSLLWTDLVLNELSNSWSEEEINKVLEKVPPGMESLYQRTLETMAQATTGKKLSNAILTWATCATRPLTTDELSGALKFDIKETVPKVEGAIAALCGQLVNVDKFGKVQIVHETAREFLLNATFKFEQAINKRDAHTRIARACLTYLTEDGMRPPRSGRRVSVMADAQRRAGFALYACEAFSYHLSEADALANDILFLVDKFLQMNVLSWIEIMARTQNLMALIRTAKHLRTYFKMRVAEAHSILGKEMLLLRGWITDLVRIVAKFGDALIMSPTAIYSLVLPFCPTETTVYSVARSGRRVSVLGLANTQWADRLSCIEFSEGRTSAICHGEEFFAIGLITGAISLYNATSFQECRILKHGEAVRFLQFKSKSNLMASCGLKTIHVWDVRSGQIIYKYPAPPRCIDLLFDENLLLAASQSNYLASWDLDSDGAQKPDRPWNDSGGNPESPVRSSLRAISISIGHKMLAAAHIGQPITLWDLETDSFYGSCGKKLANGETSTHPVSTLVFNPNVNIGLLIVSYLDGELMLLDPFADQELKGFRANCHTLVASPDGRLLAGGAGSGVVQIYEFETLRLLYRIKSSDVYIKQIAFSRDNLHFMDIRGSQCNIWEPALLLEELVADDSKSGNGITESVSVAASEPTKVKISAMIKHPREEVLFCGKQDGTVSVYDSRTGSPLQTLYSHRSLVRILAWGSQENILISIDASNGIIAWKMNKILQEGWITEERKFQSRLDCGWAISQILLNEAAGKFILSTRGSDHFWSIDGQQLDVRTYPKKSVIRKWIHHPQSTLHMICIDGSAARIFAWSDWSEIACISLDIVTTELQFKAVTSFTSNHQKRILLELSELDGSTNTRSLQLLDSTSFSVPQYYLFGDKTEASGFKEDTRTTVVADEAVVPINSSPLLGPLTHCVAHVIGIRDPSKLIFLDTHSWVCSVDLGALDGTSMSYVRHFFVPYDWFSGTRDLICMISKRNVLFARNDNVVVVQGGLDHMEKVEKVYAQ